MGRGRAEGEKSKSEKRRSKKIKLEKVRTKNMHVREKVGKSHMHELVVVHMNMFLLDIDNICEHISSIL